MIECSFLHTQEDSGNGIDNQSKGVQRFDLARYPWRSLGMWLPDLLPQPHIPLHTCPSAHGLNRISGFMRTSHIMPLFLSLSSTASLSSYYIEIA